MFVEKDRAILVVVDVQEKLLPAIYNGDQVVENTRSLVALAKTYDLPLVLTEQYPKGLGKTVAPLVEELGDLYSPVEKMTFSCMGEPLFKSRVFDLRKEGRDQALVAGIEAHVCVYQTVVHLLSEGWEVHLAADGVGSRSQENHQRALELMALMGAWIKPTETLIFEMLVRAGTPQFKAMMPYVK